MANSAVRLVSARGGGSEARQPPTVTVAPAAFSTPERVTALIQWMRINLTGVDTMLERILDSAASEAEGVIWRAVLTQTRERIWTHEPGGRTQSRYETPDDLFDSRAFRIGEPFATVTLTETDINGTSYTVDTDATEPAHGLVWASWQSGMASYKASYTCGWADDAVPLALEQTIYQLAEARFKRDTAAAVDARRILEERWTIRERPGQIGVGSLID